MRGGSIRNYFGDILSKGSILRIIFGMGILHCLLCRGILGKIFRCLGFFIVIIRRCTEIIIRHIPVMHQVLRGIREHIMHLLAINRFFIRGNMLGMIGCPIFGILLICSHIFFRIQIVGTVPVIGTV